MGELGERLRQAREAKGLTFEQIEEATKIRRRYLQALEDEDYGQFPGEVYIRGFLRNYAQVLGLDPEEILAAAGRPTAPPVLPVSSPQEPVLEEPLTMALQGNWLMAVAIGAMVIIALGLGAWMFERYLVPDPSALPSREPPARAGEQVTATGTKPPATGTQKTPSPTETPAGSSWTSLTPENATGDPLAGETGALLRLETISECWLRIVVDGRLAYEGTLEPGQIKEWRGRQQIVMRAGNAGALRIWYNGQEQSSMGSPGEVIEQTWGSGPLPEPGSYQGPAVQGTPGPLGAPPSPLPTAAPTFTSAAATGQ